MSTDSDATENGATEILDPEQDDNEVDLGPPSADSSLRYFGVDFDVEGLVRRFDREELIIPRFDPEEPTNKETGFAGFQRQFVWKKKQMDRFIESILLGYPIPGIFLVELPSRQYIVLDGQQRLTTLSAFYKGQYPTANGEAPFTLDYAAAPYSGLTYETLSAGDRRLLNNAIIQATVVLPSGKKGKMAAYSLFERINSGGTKLNEQQIRVALYTGRATQMIREMNRDASWRSLFGAPHHRDLKDQELILRYLSLKEVASELRSSGDDKAYKPPLATFMSSYLDRNEAMPDELYEKEKELFSSACSILAESVGTSAIKRNRTVNAARMDAILAGLALALQENPKITQHAVRSAFESLESNDDFLENTTKSTSHRSAVNTRLRASVQAFLGQ